MINDDNDKKKKWVTSSETWSRIKVRFECDRSDCRIVVNEDCDKDEDRNLVQTREVSDEMK